MLSLIVTLLALGVSAYNVGAGGQNQGGGGGGYGFAPPQNSQQNQQQARLQEVFSWTEMDFNFPSAQARQQAIQSKTFVPSTVGPIGVAAAGPRVFIAMPRWRNGVPATLATVPFPANSTSPRLTPYPNWAFNRQGNCEGLTSVFRVKVDECNRLWVLDTGIVNAFVTAQQLCPPQVLVFDLKNDKMIYRYRFPADALKPDSLLVTIEVEYPRAQCGPPTSAVLYVADVTTYALIVSDLAAGRAWRVTDKTMYPSPEAGTFTVNRETFELMDGVLGLALSPPGTPADRLLYYHAMSGFRQRWVSTSILRNETAATSSPRAFQTAAQPRTSQVAGCGMDQAGVLFFGLIAENALACWNTRKPFNRQTLVPLEQNDKTMQFFSTTTVDQQGRLWAISNRFQSFFLGTLNPRDINYRIFFAPDTRALVRGTACERGGHGHGSQGGEDTGVGNQLVFRP